MKPTRYYCPNCRQPLPTRKNIQPAVPMSLWNPDGDTLDQTKPVLTLVTPRKRGS